MCKYGLIIHTCSCMPLHARKCPQNLRSCQVHAQPYPEVIGTLTFNLCRGMESQFVLFFIFCVVFIFTRYVKACLNFRLLPSTFLQMDSNFQEPKQPRQPCSHALRLYHTLCGFGARGSLCLLQMCGGLI